jgi:hypothetical protein
MAREVLCRSTGDRLVLRFCQRPARVSHPRGRPIERAYGAVVIVWDGVVLDTQGDARVLVAAPPGDDVHRDALAQQERGMGMRYGSGHCPEGPPLRHHHASPAMTTRA